MNTFLAKVSGKLQEARISNVNYELGKVKESIIHESSSYVESIISRSESIRFSHIFASKRTSECNDESTDIFQSPNLQKSSSLPAISSCVDAKKYKYKSSLQCPEERDEKDTVENDSLSPTITSKNIDESIVEKFIRVVEVKEAKGGGRAASSLSHTEVKTREDIRRKLAFPITESAGIGWATAPLEERANGFKRGFQESNDGDLEICFINQVAGNSDNDDEGRSSPLIKRSLEKDYTTANNASLRADDDLFHSLKYEWDSFQEQGCQQSAHHRGDQWQNLAQRREALKKRLVKLQWEVKRNLLDCRHTAQRQIEMSKHRRQDDDPLGRLLTLPALDVNATSGRKFDAGFLESLNVAKLQIIVNHYHNDFERLNEQLMRLLLDKDELQIEQDGQLLDIADLSCSFRF